MMAYQFTASSQQFLTVPVDSAFEFGTGDFTVAGWARAGSSGFNSTAGDPVAILGPGPSTTTTCGWCLWLFPSTINWYRYDGSVETNLARSFTFASSTWYHVAANRIGTSLSLFVDGAQQGASFTNSLSYNRIDSSSLQVGKIRTGNPGQDHYSNSRFAELAIWKGYGLTAAEIAALAKGVAAPTVRSRDLSFYAPMVRNLQDLRGGLAITNNNTATVADHPRIYR